MLRRLSPTQSPEDLPPGELVLWESARGPSLAFTGPHAPSPIQVDFGAGDLAHRRKRGGSEALVKSIRGGRKGPLKIVDATAGFGTDAFLLAWNGMEVVMVEREPELCLLLEEALRRGKTQPHLAEPLGRLSLVRADSREYLGNLEAGSLDAVSLDPMFPGRRGSALPAKEIQALRLLLGAPPDQEEERALLAVARHAAARVVVKRPRRAPPFGGVPPQSQRKGRQCRFDLYLGSQGTFKAWIPGILV